MVSLWNAINIHTPLFNCLNSNIHLVNTCRWWDISSPKISSQNQTQISKLALNKSLQTIFSFLDPKRIISCFLTIYVISSNVSHKLNLCPSVNFYSSLNRNFCASKNGIICRLGKGSPCLHPGHWLIWSKWQDFTTMGKNFIISPKVMFIFYQLNNQLPNQLQASPVSVTI